MELFPDVAGLSNYRYSYLVTNMALPMKVIYDTYRGRADSENRIKEIKYDFSVDKFTVHGFWANEAYANFIIMAYNLYSLFRLVMTNNQSHPFMKKGKVFFAGHTRIHQKEQEQECVVSGKISDNKKSLQRYMGSHGWPWLPILCVSSNDRFGINIRVTI